MTQTSKGSTWEESSCQMHLWTWFLFTLALESRVWAPEFLENSSPCHSTQPRCDPDRNPGMRTEPHGQSLCPRQTYSQRSNKTLGVPQMGWWGALQSL